ncbi:bifunctional adenosylcobinamide kinase/adenosylcobinamide-phosphate guanylyltransferase [bacterium]|nr:bifunctional adenosylcobinamide kinase/adenosylcobinamide-phosphate guanylyltransferase [bacterium]
MAITLLVGGARSGKTAAAEAAAAATGRPVVYIATGEPLDEEMAARIDRHRRQRPQAWLTVEAPRELVGTVAAADGRDCLVIDCLTLWVSNTLDESDDTILGAAEDLATALADRLGPSVVVTNEVGAGIVPADAGVRRYRDLLGWVNAIFRAKATTSYYCVAGGVIPIDELRL